MERFILDSSKGLVEVTRGAQKTIQFIHESVRSYLLQETGFPELQPRLASNIEGFSHDDLRQHCQNYLLLHLAAGLYGTLAAATHERWEELRMELPTMFPFLQYTVSGLLYHADIAQSHRIAQDVFVNERLFSLWILVHNVFERAKIRQHSADTTKGYIFADQSATHLLEVEIKEHGNFNNPVTAGSFRTAIGVATSRGNERDVELLLRNGGDPMSMATSGTTALELATKRGYTNIVRSLLQHGADPDYDPKKKGYLLYSAAKQGRIEIVQILLDHGVDPNAVPHHDRRHEGTALGVAAAAGHKRIVELLIGHHADFNARQDPYGSALHAASCNGHLDIVGVLLEHNADYDMGGDRYGTPLHVAAITGNEQVINMLIDKGAKVDVKSVHLGTPLCIASAKGNKNVVELLLGKGADINLVDDLFGSPLQAASYQGLADVAELLLKRGADVNIVGGRYDTALRAASSKGHVKVVEILLSNGADVNYYRKPHCPPPDVFKNGWPVCETWLMQQVNELSVRYRSSELAEGTALQEALLHGRRALSRRGVVELLLRWGADRKVENVRHETDQSAVLEGWENRAALQSGCGADADKTTLHEAALWGLDEVVDGILHQYLEVDVDSYEMALQVALDQGNEKVTKLLLDHGAQTRQSTGSEGSHRETQVHREVVDLTSDDTPWI
jgi:ankyrin repeat protein